MKETKRLTLAQEARTFSVTALTSAPLSSKISHDISEIYKRDPYIHEKETDSREEARTLSVTALTSAPLSSKISQGVTALA